jgi:hypothetical protein
LGGEFRAAALNKVAGFGDDVFQDVREFADSGFAINEFRK